SEKSPRSSASTPALSCARSAFNRRPSSLRRCWRTRSASRTASLAFWYSPASTILSSKASCSGVRLMLRVGIVNLATSRPRAQAGAAIEKEHGGQRPQAEDDQQSAPGRPVQPVPVVGDQEKRGSGVQQAGVVEALALPALAEERDGQRQAQVDPVPAQGVLAAAHQVAERL